MSDTKPMYASAQVIPESIQCPGSSVIGLWRAEICITPIIDKPPEFKLGSPCAQRRTGHGNDYDTYNPERNGHDFCARDPL